MPYIPAAVPDLPETVIVVPCYNEAERLPVEQFRRFAAEHARVRFLFVNDGSRDATGELIGSLAAGDPQHFEALELAVNGGKAEAVRRGMLHALASAPQFAGYWDADLATPLHEIPRFIAALQTHPGCEVCFGARVRLLGRAIERHAVRHYLGRLFATAASFVLDLPVYDTQCGAKLFRVLPHSTALFSERFCVNWTFDVEIIARVQAQQANGASVIYELPLNEWRDVAGSKVRPSDFAKGLLEILRIYTKYGRGGRRLRALAPPEQR